MRLIDADEETRRLIKLKEKLNVSGKEVVFSIDDIINIFEKCPTAHDVEKVVEELKDKSFVDYDEYYTDNGECLIEISSAVEIVRGGRKNE